MSNEECGRFQDRIADRVAGELSEEEAVRLEEHLSECPDCLAFERSLSARLDRLRGLGRATWSGSPRGAGVSHEGGGGIGESGDRLDLARLEARLLRAFRADAESAHEAEGGERDSGPGGRSRRPPSVRRWTRERDGGRVGSRRLIEILLRPVPAYAAVVLVAVACLSGIWIGHREGPVTQRVPPVGPPIAAPETPGSPGLADRQEAAGAQVSAAISRGEIRTGGFQIMPRDAVSLAGALDKDTL